MSMLQKIAVGQAEFDGRPWLSMSKVDRDRYIERARLAVEAMSEPSEDMVDAGIYAKTALYEKMKADGKDTRFMCVSKHPAGTIYCAMIKAALEWGA